jgi:transcriptional regulator with XRE-family HTH domain
LPGVNIRDLPIGRQLKVERVAAGIPLTDLANDLGISAGHLSNVEAGKRTATPDLVTRIRETIKDKAA